MSNGFKRSSKLPLLLLKLARCLSGVVKLWCVRPCLALPTWS